MVVLVDLESSAVISKSFHKNLLSTTASASIIEFWPLGVSSTLLRFVYERRARRDKIVPAKRMSDDD